MKVNLVYFRRNGQRKDILVQKPLSVLGRRDDCDVRIPLMGVSRQHCEVTVAGGKVTVKDLGSSNGTFVNQQRITEQDVKGGDLIQMGSVVLTLQVDGEPSAITPPTAEQVVAEPLKGLDVDVELEPDDEDAFADLVMDDSQDDDPLDVLEALADEDGKKQDE